MIWSRLDGVLLGRAAVGRTHECVRSGAQSGRLPSPGSVVAFRGGVQNVQVVYASRHGGTAGIAERIAEVLRTEGADVVIADAADRSDPSGFDAYVIGSGVQIGRWHKEGTEFLERNQATLATRPVRLFSSGPLPGSSMTRETRDRLTLALGPEEGPVAALEHARRAPQRLGARTHARSAGSSEKSVVAAVSETHPTVKMRP
jgi:hypothetical protein